MDGGNANLKSVGRNKLKKKRIRRKQGRGTTNEQRS